MNLRIPESATVGKEAFGPFRTYLLTRGLVLAFNSEGAVVSDGVGSSVSFPVDSDPDQWGLFTPQTYAGSFDKVQHELNVRLVGFHGGSFEDVAFRVDEYLLSGGSLAEGLLSTLLALEDLVSRRAISATGITEEELMYGLNIAAALEDDISYGKVDPVRLEQAIDSYKQIGIPMDQAFFAFNATSIAEHLRHALMAAGFHFRSLNSGIQKINQTGPSSAFVAEPTNEPWELRLSSEEVQELSYVFTSSVVACCTALDLLYILFVYLTREPFLNPAFPSNLHFPDSSGRVIFRGGGSALPSDPPVKDLPYAIANLAPGQFTSLRKTRNALVHNMATDSPIPRVYKGRQQPLINHHPMQYVQYLSRDVDAVGEPVIHPWVRRFYENQSDAQDSLLEWLELTWQCAFDTTEWLVKRWSNYVPKTSPKIESES